MKGQAVRDERVLNQQRKILGEAYTLLMIILLASLLLQQFVLKAPFAQYAAEFICFFGASAYVIIRNLALGLNLYGERERAKRTFLLNSLVAAATVTLINGYFNYNQYADSYREKPWLFFFTLLITFASAALSTFMALYLLRWANERRQQQIQRKLDDEERE